MTPARLTRTAASACLVAFGLLAAPPAFAEGITKVRGKVTDPQGKPVE